MKMWKKTMIVLILLCILVSGNLIAAEKMDDQRLTKKVDAIFEPYNRKDSPGAAVLIMKDGKVIYQHGYGMANLEYDIPITPATVFHVASNSKQFTAFAILLLAAEGKLSLDDDIRKYLPQVPDFGKKITIGNLIYHTSGLRDQWELLVLAGWRMDDVITQDQILQMINRQKELNFDPGTRHLYCNTGYTLLSEIVAKISGQSLAQFAKKRIFEPLGMKNTFFNESYTTIVKNMAYSYAPAENGRGFQKSVLSYATVGATSLFTTAEDLAKWINNFETPRVGTSELMAMMQTPGKLNNGTTLNYACGLVTDDYKGRRLVMHSGADAGYRSTIIRFPDQRFAVVVLSNLATVSPENLALPIADLYLDGGVKNPVTAPQLKKHQEVAVDPAVYDDYVGRYQLYPGFILTFTNENGHLMSQATGQSKFELYPEGKDDFFAKVDEIQVIFVRNKEAKVVSLRILQSGYDLTANKLENLTLSPAQLAVYCGKYYSNELETTYQILLKDGQLLVHHPRFGDIPMEVMNADQFTCLGIDVKFVRDDQRQISGFLVNTGRVLNLKFTKVK